MKRKYVALMLGLTLAFSSVAYAEEATEAVSMEVAGEMELSEEEDALYGEITAIGEDSITVALGTMSVDEMQPAPGEGGAAEDTNAEADTSEEADAEATDADTSAAVENADLAEAPEMDANNAPEGQRKGGRGMELELTGEEQTITITEDTLFYREAAMQVPEGELPEAPAEEGTNMEVTAEDADGELLVELSEKPEQQLEEIAFEDLAEGDVLKVVLDEDGNAETVTIVMTEPEGLGDAEMMAELPEEVADEAEIMTLEEVDTEEADVQTEAAE